MAIRMEQHLFKDIVRQSYEAHKAMEQYKRQSEREKNGYTLFSSRFRNLLGYVDNQITDMDMFIFTKWDELDESEQNKWMDESYKNNFMFQDVYVFLKMFSHDR
jgi:hypothetical protein